MILMGFKPFCTNCIIPFIDNLGRKLRYFVGFRPKLLVRSLANYFVTISYNDL